MSSFGESEKSKNPKVLPRNEKRDSGYAPPNLVDFGSLKALIMGSGSGAFDADGESPQGDDFQN